MPHHHHDHHDCNPGQYPNWAFASATVINLVFTLTEVVYAVVANSMSLLADAGHNFGDTIGLAIAWWANWLLSKPSNERFSYGYKRTTILAALVNALLLVATTLIIAFETSWKLIQTQPIDELTVMILASIGIVVNGSTAMLFINNKNHDLNAHGAFLHLAADTLISIGVVITAIIIYYSRWYILDPIVSFIIVIIIFTSTWDLLQESTKLLLDAVPKQIKQADVAAYLNALPGVTSLHDLHIWGLSTREVALTVHLTMPVQSLSNQIYRTIKNDLKRQFNINHPTIQIEIGDSCQADCQQQINEVKN